MNLNDYQKKALESVAIKDKNVSALAHRTLGLSGEAGIISNTIKKAIRDKGGQLDNSDIELLKEKLGDVMYYVAVLAEYANLELDKIAADNIAKSQKFKKHLDK